MILPGNNQIHLCPRALMEIVEKHLQESQYRREDPPIRVTWVKASDGGFEFSVTTDKKEGGEA